jgi:cyclopropane fatty-acyl-phospholipid synthase-like methyltransferase
MDSSPTSLIHAGVSRLNAWYVGQMYDRFSVAMGVPQYGDDYIHIGLYDAPDLDFATAQQRLTKRVIDPLQLTPEKRLLDVGFGTGATDFYAAETYGCRVTGVTVSKRDVENARTKAASRDLGDKLEFVIADAQDLPYDSTFDAACAIESLTDMMYKMRAVRCVYRALKPGGLFAVAQSTVERGGVIGRGIAQVTGVERVWSMADTVAGVREAGFEIVDVADFTSSLENTYAHLERESAKLKSAQPAVDDHPVLRRLSGSLSKVIRRRRERVGYVYVLARKPNR